jgi:hypothetical protein
VESRVVVVTWLAQRLPGRLGLFLLLPLWAVMASMGAARLRLRRGDSWHRDGAVLVLSMTGFDRAGRGSLCAAGRTWINVGYDPFLC